MKKGQKLLLKLQSKQFQNWSFSDFQLLLKHLGFSLSRIKGSHHIYTHPNMILPFPIQPIHGQAKSYQLKQILEWMEKRD